MTQGTIWPQAGAGEATAALAGIRVLDFSRMLPGPWCTQMLADFGADVIKVEQAGTGDPSRHNPPDFDTTGVYFQNVNRGKRSLAVDLKTAEDRALVHALMAEADVIVESYRVGVPARLEVDYETAKRLKPDIIYCSITGYGQTGPLASIPGHDLVVQSVTGVMGAAPRDAGDLPPVPQFQAADYAAANFALIGILTALHKRARTGEGAFLDVSMFDTLYNMTGVIAGAALSRLHRDKPVADMELFGGNPRYATYRVRDGAVAVSLLEAHIWARFCRVIGREDLIDPDEGWEQRHTDHGDRSALYREALATYCLAHTRDELAAKMLAHDIPITPVLTPQEALRSEHVAGRKLVEWVEHPRDGRIPVLANPLAASGLAVSSAAAPDLDDVGPQLRARLG